MKKKTKRMLIIIIILGLLSLIVWVGVTYLGGRNGPVFAFIKDPYAHQDWITPSGLQCQNAPFIIPSGGYIGYLYEDVFKLTGKHTGIDIFGGVGAGEMPVYAPYDGFITREEGWKSSLILRIPQDPLQPDRQIWVYMTHMADRYGNGLIDQLFPPGAKDVPVKQGQILGFQGDFSGDPKRPVGVHLHLSIVKDDGTGHYMNETILANTLDPSPYFGMNLNAKTAVSGPVRCLLSVGID